MNARRPPVIPEIAKAYQNDPRTLLAMRAMDAGSSSAPVAAGNYGYVDGIARVLQGLGGAYMDKKTQDRYGADEADLLATRKARGVDGLTGAGLAAGAAAAPVGLSPQQAAAVASPSLSAPPSVPAQAAAMLGAPPPAAVAPPGPPLAPMAPVAPTLANPALANGGGSMGRRPFPSTVSSGVNPAPVPEAIPDAPAVLTRPNAPEAVGPTRSKMLDAAYKVMSDANPYESAGGQDMYVSGLTDQGKMDEAAAERRQKLVDMGYSTDLSNYADSQSQGRSDTYQERRDAQTRNFTASQAYVDRGFKANESSLERSKDLSVAHIAAASALAVAKVKEAGDAAGGTALNSDERAALSTAVGAGKLDLKGVTKFQAKVVAQALIDNPGLDAIHLHAIATLASNPAAQQKAALVQAVPTVLASVRDAGKKLNFSDAKFVGNLQAFVKGQFNDPDFASYMSQRNDAMQTLAQVMSGVGATDIRTKMEAEAAPQSMSPKAWDGWYQGQVRALMPRIKMYEDSRLLPEGTSQSYQSILAPSASTPYKASNGYIVSEQ